MNIQNISQIAAAMNTTPAIAQRLCERGLLPVRNGVASVGDAKRALQNNSVTGAIAGIRRELAEQQTAKRQEVQRRQGNTIEKRVEQSMYTAAESRGRVSLQLELLHEQEQRLVKQVEEIRAQLEQAEAAYEELLQHHIK